MNETYAANYENPEQYLGTADQALPNIRYQLGHPQPSVTR
jgi:hypothetical protein